jgi:DNA-binding CsgD family transcriptional regulator
MPSGPNSKAGQDLSKSDRWTTRLAEIGISWPLLPSAEETSHSVRRTLAERGKKLSCLYALSQLSDKPDTSLDDYLAAVVDILPASWQYPETACARIVIGDRIHESLFFRPSPMGQTASVKVRGEIIGEVSVFYAEPRPEEAEGPFLQEERLLLNEVAERIGWHILRKENEESLAKVNRQLNVERAALKEANTALRTVLTKIEEEKLEIHRNIDENVRKILMPILQAMSPDLPPDQVRYVALLRENLEGITSPFVRRLSREFQALTPAEIRVCEMIRAGHSTKEIARLRGVSAATVNRQREHIRRKLGLTNRPVNLSTYLQTTL